MSTSLAPPSTENGACSWQEGFERIYPEVRRYLWACVHRYARNRRLLCCNPEAKEEMHAEAMARIVETYRSWWLRWQEDGGKRPNWHLAVRWAFLGAIRGKRFAGTGNGGYVDVTNRLNRKSPDTLCGVRAKRSAPSPVFMADLRDRIATLPPKLRPAIELLAKGLNWVETCDALDIHWLTLRTIRGDAASLLRDYLCEAPSV